MNESQRTEQALQQLALLIRRHAPTSGTYRTEVPSLSLMHATHLSEPLESVYKPSICVVAQGAKIASLANETFRYDPSTYLVTSVELPITGRIVDASPEIPYLSLKLSFDADVIMEIVKKTNRLASVPMEGGRGITVNQTSPALLETIVRLMQMLDTPEDIPVLAPLVIREVLYRMLQGEQGALLYQFATNGSHAYSIAQAIRLINRQYARPLSVEQLAKSVNMSVSAFHKHFKRVTAMSPLQYQKTVRLQEARRLMLTESVQASDAAFRVGYESPSQFSREYARMYGQPPKMDVQKLRNSIRDSKVLV
ncbi:AraC family transcriptional regulator [Paenibacillus oenotherae]|uniref:AraC family transcriptional regulator n=1 Tax=Paenibacillus oenotherae TaxID=1435645 RepID=A0ABS7D722_9BACL|nr:AraC family transcriptional regulator [Paenibacillus oenotherae]MBW7475573.1 AraC family transcriptional regulator [Paenibacillus oenotherae]